MRYEVLMYTDPAHTRAEVRRLEMPTHHDVRATDVNEKRLGAVMPAAQLALGKIGEELRKAFARSGC